MKKIALALTAAATVILGSAGVADASAYPPANPSVEVEDSTPEPGGFVEIFVPFCLLGETVTVELGDADVSIVCNIPHPFLPGFGSAEATVRAPRSAGSFTGTVTGSISGALGSFTITVGGTGTPGTPATPSNPSTGLPATGSDGTNTITTVAGGLLLAGIGMFGVATVRRRQDIVAA